MGEIGLQNKGDLDRAAALAAAQRSIAQFKYNLTNGDDVNGLSPAQRKQYSAYMSNVAKLVDQGIRPVVDDYGNVITPGMSSKDALDMLDAAHERAIAHVKDTGNAKTPPPPAAKAGMGSFFDSVRATLEANKKK